MRIPASILVVVLCSATSALAQGVTVGAKGGVNFATVDFAAAGDASKGRWSPLAGAFVVLPIHWGIALQTEGLYTQKGGRLHGTAVDSSLLLDYFEIPVLARVSMNAFGGKLYFVGGPCPAFRLRARTRTEFNGATEEIDVASAVKRFDLGVAGGAGMEFGSLVVEGRYTFGLTDVNKDPTDAAPSKNRAISVTAGWRF
jgi:hypothetical protein